MRKLSESEVLSMREILQMECNNLKSSKIMEASAKDNDLKKLVTSGISTCEQRIKCLQQFISENDILESKEVH